jgi:hypothetical protein
MVAPAQRAAMTRVTSAHPADPRPHVPHRPVAPGSTTERLPRAPDQRFSVQPRFTPPRALFRDAYRLVRRPSRVTLGAAAVTAAVAAAVIAAVSSGHGHGSAGQPNDLAAVARHGADRAPAHQSARVRPVVKQAPSKQQAASQHQQPDQVPWNPASHQPYTFYDSVIPSAVPAGQPIATYATGGYAVSPAQVAGHKLVMWIDTQATDPAASALDIEPGAATPEQAATWAYQRLHMYPNALARLYTSQSEWPAVQAAVATLPAQMRSHIRWWIADPTGTPHMVPGADATQWYWGSGYDTSSATPRF